MGAWILVLSGTPNNCHMRPLAKPSSPGDVKCQPILLPFGMAGHELPHVDAPSQWGGVPYWWGLK